jgi:hypothetical protein
MILDFGSYIDEKARLFIGREWVFQDISDWLAKPDGSRHFLLTGEPGSGKTALAARLAQFSLGSAHPPARSQMLSQGFLNAVHFCRAGASSWLDPRTFARSISLQLTSILEFKQALIDVGDRDVNIDVLQRVDMAQSGASITGVHIENLVISGLSGQEAFNRTVLDPLRTIDKQGYGQPIVILVDSLDEALAHAADMSIVDLVASLQDVAPQVRFIVTSRQEPRVEIKFREAHELFLSAPNYKSANDADIRAYVTMRVKQDEQLARRMATMSATEISALVDDITVKAEGNFQYVAFLLKALAEQQLSLDDVAGLPPGLDGLYFDSLDRVVKLGKKDWATTYKPLLGVLSVAQEPLTLGQMQAFSQLASDAWDALGDLLQFIETVPPSQQSEAELAPATATQDNEERYRLYHQSVVDFFRRRQLMVRNDDKTKTLHNLYFLAADDSHKRVAESYRSTTTNDWQDWEHADGYGIRYVPMHLAYASADLMLVELLRSSYPLVKAHRLGSYRLLLDDFILGAQATVRLNDLPASISFVLIYSELKQRTATLPSEEILPLYAACGQVDLAVELAKMINQTWKRGRALRAIVQELAPTDLRRARDVAERIDDPEFRAEALVTVLTALSISSQSEINADSLVAHIVHLIEASQNRYWQSFLLATLAEIPNLLDDDRRESLLTRAVELAHDIRFDQWRYENLRILARIIARHDVTTAFRLYEDAINALEQMDDSDWKAAQLGETFGELSTMDMQQAAVWAGALHSIVGKPFALAHVAAQVGQFDPMRAALLIQQADAAINLIRRIGKNEQGRWERQAQTVIAWAVARYDFDAALKRAQLFEFESDKDSLWSLIALDLVNKYELRITAAGMISDLQEQSKIFAGLARSQFTDHITRSLDIISTIGDPAEASKAWRDAGIWLLAHGDDRGGSVIDNARITAALVPQHEALLLVELAAKVQSYDRVQATSLRHRAVELALLNIQSSQSIDVLIHAARLALADHGQPQALALVRQAVQRADTSRDWLLDAKATLIGELAHHDLDGALTLAYADEARTRARLLLAIAPVVARTSLDRGLALIKELVDMSSEDSEGLECELLAVIVLAAAEAGSPRTLQLAKRFSSCGGARSMLDLKSRTLAQAGGMLSQHNLTATRWLLNKAIEEPYDYDHGQWVGQAITQIAVWDRKLALSLARKAIGVYKDWSVTEHSEHLWQLCQEIAAFDPFGAITYWEESNNEPGYHSVILAHAAVAIATTDVAQARAWLREAINEASEESELQWLPIDALLEAASAAMMLDHLQVATLVARAVALARHHKDTQPLGTTLARAARILLAVNSEEHALPLLIEAIENLTNEPPGGTLKAEVLEAITNTLADCSQRAQIDLLRRLLVAMLDVESGPLESAPLLETGLKLILPCIWRVGAGAVVDNIRSLFRELNTAIEVADEMFIG